MNNKVRLQNYLDESESNIEVRGKILIDGFDYWAIKHFYQTAYIMQMLDCTNCIEIDYDYILIKHDDLVEKYGDPFNFGDDFSVKGKSALEIKARLRAFDFDFEGLFIDNDMGSRVCFIRVNSINQNNCDKLSNILNLSIGKIGRLEDKEGYLPVFWGNGWFYFKV